jgi:polyhydroxybutyrate depolymerase
MRSRWFFLVVLLACSENDRPEAADASGGGGGGGGGADAGGGGGGGGADASAASGGCGASAVQPPADEDRSLDHGGMTRQYHVHVPPGYDGSPLPLVLDFHGLTSNAEQEADYSNLRDKADAAGFVVIHATGVGASWNAGDCCGTAASSGVDDVGFVEAMLDEVTARLCIDEKRIYSTGLSNGGHISHRLACELSHRIAAVAPVAGRLALADCQPSRPVPVMAFHGTDDAIVAYGFGASSAERWGQLDGCSGDPVETFRNGDSHCATWQTCGGGAEVTMCTVDGGGHTWPGGDVPFWLGATTQDLVATDAMWEFFGRHALP